MSENGYTFIVLIISIIFFRKADFSNTKFLLFSGLTLVIISLLYMIIVRIFNNSYGGLLLTFATSILYVTAIPTIAILYVIRLLKN